ncbi:MAG: hypothetical protein ABJC66_00965 [Gammaproteobacteria bacterium]
MQGSTCTIFPRRVSTGSARPWRGHLPITSVALLELLNRAAAGRVEFSRVEWVLYVACEFWAAANAQELDAYLDARPMDSLADARRAFSAIGAVEVTRVLQEVGHHPNIDALERALLATSESVDQLIARFAGRYLREERGLRVELAFACRAAADSQA